MGGGRSSRRGRIRGGGGKHRKRERERKNTQTIYADTPATTQLGVVGKVCPVSPAFAKKFSATRLRAEDSTRFPCVEGRICGRINGGGCISNFHSNARYTRPAQHSRCQASPPSLHIPTYHAEERQLSRQVFQFFHQGGGQSPVGNLSPPLPASNSRQSFTRSLQDSGEEGGGSATTIRRASIRRCLSERHSYRAYYAFRSHGGRGKSL